MTGPVRKYGKEPCEAVLIHGGPGACGSLVCAAKELSKTFGVAEPIQSKYTISELIEELHEQINGITAKPITLMGHFWGAWLVVLYAARYPQLVKRIVLVGCAPFKKEYAPWIAERRFQNLSPEEGELFQDILSRLNSETAEDKDTMLEQLGYDPHPVEGVLESLTEQGVAYESYILPKCGHWPYKEKLAANSFYEILREVVLQGQT